MTWLVSDRECIHYREQRQKPSPSPNRKEETRATANECISHLVAITGKRSNNPATTTSLYVPVLFDCGSSS
jgi:hypothetical protein